jgi:hypothetical protein
MSSHSIKCTKHGFYYNPTESAGCMACLKEQGKTDPQRRSVVTRIFWVVALLAALGGSFVFLGSLTDRAEQIHAAAVPIESRIDPELVRGPLQALETLVYADGAGDLAYGSRIQRASMQVYTAVTVKAPKLLATRHGSRLVGFGNAASAYEDVGYQAIDMGRVRQDWEELRADVFRDAAWFR